MLLACISLVLKCTYSPVQKGSAGLCSSVLVVVLTTLLCWSCWKNYCQECPKLSWSLSDQQSCQKVEIDGWVDIKEFDKCLQSMTAGTYNVDASGENVIRATIKCSHAKFCELSWLRYQVKSTTLWVNDTGKLCWKSTLIGRHKLYLPRVLLFTTCLQVRHKLKIF